MQANLSMMNVTNLVNFLIYHLTDNIHFQRMNDIFLLKTKKHLTVFTKRKIYGYINQ